MAGDRRRSRAALITLFISVILVLFGGRAAAMPVQHGPAKGLTRVARHTLESSNWSGYAAHDSTHGAFNDVRGSWAQPTATCSRKSTAAAFWVGLDGFSSPSVEQIGTDSDCSKGNAVYYAWFEFYPDRPHILPSAAYPVAAGDAFSAEVRYADGTFILTLTNNSQNWTYTTTAADSGAARSSAEWVAEAPVVGRHSLPLTTFGSVGFSGAQATTDDDTTGPIASGGWAYDSIVLIAGHGAKQQIVASPSGLDATGGAFSISTSG